MSATAPAAATRSATPEVATEGLRFREVQRRRRVWIARGLFLAWVAFSVGQHYILSQRVEGLWVNVAFDALIYGVIGVLVFGRATLVTEVRDGTLFVRNGAGLRQEFPLSTLRSVETTGYYPAIDGNWGVERGVALRIHLDCGDFVLVGTRRPDELRAALGFPAPAA